MEDEEEVEVVEVVEEDARFIQRTPAKATNKPTQDHTETFLPRKNHAKITAKIGYI
jgi:hypothetical protein